ncbi:hypothetical protein PCH70_40910 [Pseudomonas cichorii JBC1]|nr:hypothetical protein PCH70_40910 [Pseudomonas cichorii JBC1]
MANKSSISFTRSSFKSLHSSGTPSHRRLLPQHSPMTLENIDND